MTQIGGALYVWLGLDKPGYAAVLGGLILPQMIAQAVYLLRDPVKFDVNYQAKKRLTLS